MRSAQHHSRLSNRFVDRQQSESLKEISRAAPRGGIRADQNLKMMLIALWR